MLPVMMYGNEMCVAANDGPHKLTVTQRAMERAMLRVSLWDHIKNLEKLFAE